MLTNATSGSPTTYSYFDVLGRVIRSGQVRPNGTITYTDNIYNNMGLIEKTSLPFKTTPTQWNLFYYGDDGTIIRSIDASGKTTIYRNSNRDNTYKETVISEEQSMTKTYNSLGQLILSEGDGGQIVYEYYPDNQISTIKVREDTYSPNVITTSFEYDNYGRQSKIIDPSAGIKLIAYDSSGNINKETDGNGNTVETIYDNLGRITKNIITTKKNNEISISNYLYNTDGLLISITGEGSNPVTKNFSYNQYFNPETERETISDGKWLEKKYTYSKGIPTTIIYTSNTGSIGTEKFSYQNGHLTEKSFNNTSFWRLDSESIISIPTKVTTGKVERIYDYDGFGTLKARKATVNNVTIQDFSYEFDLATSNLNSRTDNKNNKTENFAYDSYNRLLPYNDVQLIYDYKGNITSNNKVGQFFYDNISRPYAVNRIKMNSEKIAPHQQLISYNGHMRPSSIRENEYSATFIYDGQGQRIKFNLKKNNTEQLTRYYIGGQYEIESGLTGNKERLYLGGSPYTASSVYIKENGSWNFYYICRDYLGSITHVFDANGNLKQELSYDAWGKLRNPATHEVFAPDNDPVLFLGRGYTGHEHLTWYGLINMNSRLYNPVTSRFLSPDPDLKDSGMLQCYNRFSYALNNPLKYVDPNGENPLLVFGLGFLFGYTANGFHTGNWGWNSVGSGILVGTGMGASYAYTNGGNPWIYSGQFISNEIFSNIDPLSIRLGDFTMSIFPYSMLTGGIANRAGNGYALGAGMSLGYDDGKTAFSIYGIGSFRNNLRTFEGKYSAGGGHNGYSLFLNYYSGKDAQFTGTAAVQKGKFGLRWENDIIAAKMPFIGKLIGQHDRFRSNATEISWGDFTFGTNVYTTDPTLGGTLSKESGNLYTKGINASKLFNNDYKSYDQGHTILSTFYVGHKTKYGYRRHGYNDAGIGDFIQNGFHHLPFIGSPNFFRGNFPSSFYYQSGYYMPGIMY